jgi:hypothetical protein
MSSMREPIAVLAVALLTCVGSESCRRPSETDLLQSADSPPKHAAKGEGSANAPNGAPVSFGYKGAWIAVKGVAMDRVASALHLADVGGATWEQGVRKSYDPGESKKEFDFPQTSFVFVSPPVDGWTLAVGQRLAFFRSFAFKGMKEDRAPEKLLPFIQTLSKELGTTVQYFFTHRVPETHIWVWAESGRIVRAYGYSGERGEVLLDVGSLTVGETSLGLKLPAKGKDSNHESSPDEDTVIAVAGKWSIDPTTLDRRGAIAQSGVVGTLR